MTSSHIHYRSCNLCEALCGLAIEVQDNKILSVKGDKADPYSQGYLCPKGNAIQDIHTDPDRLRQPVKRTDTGWHPISWPEALQTVADQLVAIQKQHGHDALGIYYGNPPVHQHGPVLTMLPFFDMLKTRNRYSAASTDQLPQYRVNHAMFGNQLLFPISDVNHTDFWLILGGNPVISNGSITSGPNMRGRIQAIRARGGRVVVIDPRRTETAVIAGEHHFIQPGSDALFLLSFLHTLFAEGLTTLGRVADFADHLATVSAMVKPFTPERTAPHTAIPANTVRQMAYDFAMADAAACYGRVGVCQTPFGTIAHWLITLINIVTGNLDRRGGVMFSQPAFSLSRLAKIMTGGGRNGRWHSRVHNLPEFADELPVTTLADEILTPGSGQIKAMLLFAGNPVLTTPNGTKLDDALAQLDFMVALDYYINESTRHAHIILPPTSILERGNYELGVLAVQVHNVTRYSPPLFAPAKEAMADWEIIVALHTLIQQQRPFGRLTAPLVKWFWHTLTPDGIIDLSIRLGHYGFLKQGWRQGLTLKKIKAAPHGLDLGPLQPSLPQGLYTKSKRIELAPARFVAALKEVERHFFIPQKRETHPFDLRLIGRRQLRSNNSWMHNYHRLVKGKNRCTLLMHPADASARQLTNGQKVAIQSANGYIEAELTISDEMMQGVVSLPHGWGHTRSDSQWHIAQQHAGVSINALTDDSRFDTITGNAAFNGVPVRVQPLSSTLQQETSRNAAETHL